MIRKVYLLEMVTELDDGCGAEHTILIDDKLSMSERVNITLDEQQIGTALHRQETITRHVDTMRRLEVLDSCTGSGLELDDLGTIIGRLGVDDDLEFHALVFHDTFESFEIDPDVVSVEDLELANGFEIFDVLRWYLRNL